jgi:hypothetical protein
MYVIRIRSKQLLTQCRLSSAQTHRENQRLSAKKTLKWLYVVYEKEALNEYRLRGRNYDNVLVVSPKLCGK